MYSRLLRRLLRRASGSRANSRASNGRTLEERRLTLTDVDKRGRDLGFPTANLVPRNGYVTTGHGVYACRTGEGHVAAVNVGVRPMFVTGRGELIEAFLLDFDGDLYGSQLRVEFLKRLRGERRFESVDALIEQMALDVDEARAVALR